MAPNARGFRFVPKPGHKHAPRPPGCLYLLQRRIRQGETAVGKSHESGHQPLTKSVANAAIASFEEMDRFFGEFFNRWPRSWVRPFRWDHPHWGDMSAMGTLPKVDVLDREAEFVVRAELPGVRKEDVEVSVSDQRVTIRGCTRHEQRGEGESYFRTEISRGEFIRTVELPSGVDPGIARARLENGVLEVILPKTERARRHTIRVE
jgi:HSP20 family protein